MDSLAEMVSALGANDFARLNHALAKARVRLDADLDIATLLELVGVLMGSTSDGGGAASAGAFGRQLGKSVGHIPTDLILVGRALELLDGITETAPESPLA